MPAAAAIQGGAQAQTPQAGGTLTVTASSPESAGSGVPAFFTGEQFAALQRLCALLVPGLSGRPGAEEAAAAEFLDFLAAKSAVSRGSLYRKGLDELNRRAKSRYGKSFAELDEPQTVPLLEPLRGDWSAAGSADQLTRFLMAVKEEALQATLNSREWSVASGRRGAAGLNYYWRVLE